MRADIITTLTSSTRFRTWTTILVRTLFIEDLREGAWVVVAPTDAAFAKLGERALERLFAEESVERLVDLAEQSVRRIDRDPAVVAGGSVVVLPSAVSRGTPITERMACTNGFVWVVDRVVLPPLVRGEPRRRAAG